MEEKVVIISTPHNLPFISKIVKSSLVKHLDTQHQI